MQIQVTAVVMGHPWDLWGLSRMFDGSDVSKTLVRAEKPNGLPTFDATDRDAINHFRVWGYDTQADVTSTELLWDMSTGKVDLRDMRPVADNLIERINGVALLFDDQYKPVRPFALNWAHGGAAGSTIYSEWIPNKSVTSLGSVPEMATLAGEVLALAAKEQVGKFVLDAIVLAPTWASLYLVYDAIATNVGGVHALRKKNWVTEDTLRNLTNSANNSRDIKEGARHGNASKQDRALIPLEQASLIARQLTLCWLSEKMGAG
jgi:hypothetical protein